MTETLASQSTQAKPLSPTEENLRLKCPRCNGGLNLKRKYLGVTGQCVHCQSPLTAIEENGEVRVVTDGLTAVTESHHTPVSEATPAPIEASAPAPAPIEASAPAPIEASAPAPVEAPVAGLESSWSLPDFSSLSPSTHSAPTQKPEAISSCLLTDTTGYHVPLPTREDADLFKGRPESLPTPAPRAEVKAAPSPFGESTGFALSFPPMFASNEETGSISPAWGTNMPGDAHASISPFGTGSAGGGGFAEGLFREKGVKDASAKSDSSPIAPFTPYAAPAPAAEPSVADATPKTPRRDCEEKVILDGDGRPMRPMSKDEESDFAKNFFKYENTRTKPRWQRRLLKKLTRMLIGLCVLSAIGAIAACFTPKEKLIEIKEDAIEWLKPGMAIFDYLPDSLRPEWLPRTEFGIDAGVDEKGQPKKKLNAFEGLDKLKGDIGNIRGAADNELKKLNEM